MLNLISVPQAAMIKGCSKTYILKLINQGRLKAQKVGRDWVIRREDLNSIAPASSPVGRPKKVDNKAKNT